MADIMSNEGFRLMLLAALLLVTSNSGEAQSTRTPFVAMEELTVPGERLPTGCRLAPRSERAEGGRIRTFSSGLLVSTNPWIGTDPQLVASIRQRMEPPSKVPDGPPMTTSQLARFRLKLAEGVDEAYIAVYKDAGPELILVYAVRFASLDDVPRVRDSRAPKNPRLTRVELGRTVAMVHGDGGECFQAIGAYLQSFAP